MDISLTCPGSNLKSFFPFFCSVLKFLSFFENKSKKNKQILEIATSLTACRIYRFCYIYHGKVNAF